MKVSQTVYMMAAIVAVTMLAFMPVVAADPISPSLNWSVTSVPQGLSTTATVTVNIDPDCPSGQTFSGTITVTESDGVSVGTYAVPVTPCGTDVTAPYPSAFSGAASTTELGSYTASWAGSSTAPNNPSFNVIDHFMVVAFPPPPVPQFALPALLVAAMGMLLVATMRKSKSLKV